MVKRSSIIFSDLLGSGEDGYRWRAVVSLIGYSDNGLYVIGLRRIVMSQRIEMKSRRRLVNIDPAAG